jgi:hypothetical protein
MADPRIVSHEIPPGDGVGPNEQVFITNPSNTIHDPLSLQNVDLETRSDSDWVSSSFLIPDVYLDDKYDKFNRFYSTAKAKWTDTRIGGAIGINPKPQFTRYADIREQGRLEGRLPVELANVSGNVGMGRFYSEAFDDHAQKIFMTFGVPQFNTLTNFIGRAFNPTVINLARTGRVSSGWNTLGKIAGVPIGIGAFGLGQFVTIAATLIGGQFLAGLLTNGSSKFYTLKPSMHLYWSIVNNLANNLAIRMGLFPALNPEGSDTPNNKINTNFQVSSNFMGAIGPMYGDVWNTLPGTGDNANQQKDAKDRSAAHGFFDIFAVASRTSRIQNELFMQDYENMNEGNAGNFEGLVRRTAYGEDKVRKTRMTNNEGEPNFLAYLNKITMMKDWWFSDKGTGNVYTETNPVSEHVVDYSKLGVDSSGEDVVSALSGKSWVKEFAEQFDSDIRDGSRFAIFQVDYTGPQSEGWSNQHKESDLAHSINDWSQNAKDIRFTFMDGNLSGPTNVLKDAIGAAAEFATGALSTITMGLSDGIIGALKGLTGQGFIDIPHHWDSSQFQPTQANYTIKLISPYGNPVSRFTSIYIPLCMLMAGALPLSTGHASYTSPLLCQIFDRGRIQIRLGLITSLQITRGTSNLGFTSEGKPLAIDVNFSVADLSSIMHMPIAGNSNWISSVTPTWLGGKPDMAMDEDNILSDYLGTLTGQSIYSQLYIAPRLKMRTAMALMNANMITSPFYMGSAIHDWTANTVGLSMITSALSSLATANTSTMNTNHGL